MRRLMIFGMFIGMMIARPSSAFFGRKEIEKIKSPPHIDSIEPSAGAPCIPVTIKGKNLGSLGTVRFRNTTAQIIEQSNDKLVVEVPYGGIPYIGEKEETVEVTVGMFDNSNSVLFTYKKPTIDSISPSFGKVGTEVVIKGRHFGIKGPHPTFCVEFGKSLFGVKLKSWTDTEIIAGAPSDYGTGKTDERVMDWLKKFAIAGVTGGMTIPDFVLNVIEDLATSGVRIPPGESKIEVDVRVTTPTGKSNTKIFTYQLTDETLPTLPPPTWKEIPLSEFGPKDGLATALVVDRSGSMSGEKIRRAKEAAYIYVDTSAEGRDMFSLAAFSSDAKSITEPISIADGREILKKDILSLSAGGSTNVGSGLTIALSHLSSSNLKEKRAVLMSDGQHNTGTYQPEVAEFQKMGWPIDTVAFGRDADQEMLSQVAYQTGGNFYPAETSDISSIYHKINVLAHQGSVYRSYNDFIRPGQKLTYDILVEPDMRKVGFFTNWQGSSMETTLISPSQLVINRSNIQNYGSFVEGQTHNCFELNNPQVGPWQALITGYDLPPKGEQINFHSFCQSDVFSNFLGFQPSYSQNSPVQIGLKLAEVINGRLSPLRGVQVIAEIKKPSLSLNKVIKQQRLEPLALMEIFREISGSTQKITLFDNGSHNDIRPGDGIYANSYKETTLSGPYLVTIDCQGSTSQGLPLKRTLQESFQVGPIEQNSFTISDFLGLLTQQSVNRQIPFPIPGTEGPKETQTEELINSLLNLLKK